MKRTIGAVVLSAVLGLAGCGSSSKGGGPANVTISGTLSGGTIFSRALASAPPASPFAGYQLYCVTFANPPASAAATADASGAVSLTLAALNVPFGCFILDPDGKGKATLFFGSDSTAGQTLTLSGDANLGTITVDPTSGMASADLPSNGTVVTTTPAGTACPVGTWDVTSGSYTCNADCVQPCAPDGVAKVWIAQSANGEYTASFTHQGCHWDSYSNVPATYADGVLTIGPFASAGSQCNQTATVRLTPNSDCTAASGTGTWTECGSCGQTGETICPSCPDQTHPAQTCSGNFDTITRE